MNGWTGTLTRQGEAFLASLKDDKFTISSAKCSSAEVIKSELYGMTELTDIIKNMDILSISSNKSIKVIELQLLNTGIKATTEVKQIGLYVKTDDTDEILFAVWQTETPTVVPKATLKPWSKQYDLYLTFSSLDNVTIEVNTTGYLPESHNTDTNAHKDIRELIEVLKNGATNEDLEKLETSINALEDELANVKSSLNDLATVNYYSQIELKENISVLYNIDLNKVAHNVVLTIDVTSKSISSSTFNIGVIPEPCRPKKNVALNTLTSKGTMCYLFIDTDGKFGFRKESASATWSSETVRACVNYIVD